MGPCGVLVQETLRSRTPILHHRPGMVGGGGSGDEALEALAEREALHPSLRPRGAAAAAAYQGGEFLCCVVGHDDWHS